jgi:hypothetical protein
MIALCVGAPASYAGGGGGQHPGIKITSNGDFVGCGCFTSGDGSAARPFVIGPWAITTPNASGSAITIDNSSGLITDYFTITGISVNYNDTDPTHRSHPVIYVNDVNTPTTISNVSANDDGTGIELDNSSNIRLDSISVNKLNGTGVRINNSSYIFLSNGKYKATSDGLDPSSHWADGLYAVGSSHLYIGGPQVPACPKTGVCNTFDYDSGWGVYLQDTHDVMIDNATANADDTGGFVLDGSQTYNVTLENSTSEAGGPICISLNGMKSPSGYTPTDLVGGLMLVNGTYGDTISNDTFNGTSSSSGFSIGDGGNAVLVNNVLTPFYFDVCKGANLSAPSLDGPMDSPGKPLITFSSVCYSTTDIPPAPRSPQPPPPSVCNS